jgi:hypothetical protein
VAIGREASERGGVIDPVDVRGAGPMEWAQMVGISPDHPLVGAGGEAGFNAEERWSRVVTRPYSQAGPAADTIATPDGATMAKGGGGLGHWRDVFNFRGSAVPWLLLLLIGIIYFSHLKLSASGSAGGFGKHVRAGAALD